MIIYFYSSRRAGDVKARLDTHAHGALKGKIGGKSVLPGGGGREKDTEGSGMPTVLSTLALPAEIGNEME